jgi:outer membrane protein OmpA-like peptidoglycan-associated protein
MKKVFIGAIVIHLCVVSAIGQTLQWATKVIEYSSQLTPGQYSAQQALGKPNVLPAGGENPNAWVPDRPHRKEFLKLGFANPTNIRQIAIAESYNPSALHRVLVYDESGREYEVNTLNPKVIPLKGRMLNVFFEQTRFKVVAVKLEFDGSAVPDYFGIDAVGITDSSYPVIPDITQPALLESGIIVEPLDKNVNSDVSELNPLLSPDGKTLYFSRRNHPDNVGGVDDKEDIWYSELGEDGKWQLAKNMGPQFNNESPNFLNAITATPDGKSVIMILGNKYVEGKKKMQAGVSISSKVGGHWTKPVALNITNEYNFSDKANYFLTNNRKTMLMSLQREDSRGDRDLYVTFMQDDSIWTEPLNLGRVVNTAAEESAPFLAADDKTLYFSSKGFSGFGGNDIYVSKRLDDTWTKWSEPENLGPTINSAQEDLFFNIPANSEFAYYSRGVSETNLDIFRVGLPIMKSPEPWVTVTGELRDGKTGEPLAAKIIYERLPDGTDLGISQSEPKTGAYEIILPGGHLYSIRAEAKDYMSESQTLDLRDITADTKITNKNFSLKPIQVVLIEQDATMRLNTIFFDFAKAILKPEAFPELDRIVKIMTERPEMHVEIAGHTDNIGSDEFNQGLSERRANAVVKYIISKGINKARITAVGYGEKRPLVSNDDEKDGREINRRVEIKIVKL